MSEQLIYTSAPKGLEIGKSGFCVVATSQGLASNLAKELESLSGYRHIFSPGDPNNPISLCHVRLRVGGKLYHIISRVADAGLDHTGRSNMLAHHVAIDAAELPDAGPAWLLAPERKLLRTSWDEEPQILPPFTVPQGQDAPAVCGHWKALTGDAGWGGALAQAIADKSKKPVALIYPANTNVFPLLQESLRLLPENRRWEATFNTFFTKALPGLDYRWRCFCAETPEADAARRDPGNIVIDLANPVGLIESEYVQAARTGKPPAIEVVRPRTAAQTRPTPSRAAAPPGGRPPRGAGVPGLRPLQKPPGKQLPGINLGKGASRRPTRKSKTGLIVSLAAAIVFLLAAAGASFFYFKQPAGLYDLVDPQTKQLVRLQEELDRIEEKSRGKDPVPLTEQIQSVEKIRETLQSPDLLEPAERNQPRQERLDTKVNTFYTELQLRKLQEAFDRIKQPVEGIKGLPEQIAKVQEILGELDNLKLTESDEYKSFKEQLTSWRKGKEEFLEYRRDLKAMHAKLPRHDQLVAQIDQLSAGAFGKIIDQIQKNLQKAKDFQKFLKESQPSMDKNKEQQKKIANRIRILEERSGLYTRIQFVYFCDEARLAENPADLKGQIATVDELIEHYSDVSKPLPDVDIPPPLKKKLSKRARDRRGILKNYREYLEACEKIAASEKKIGSMEGSKEIEEERSRIERLKDEIERHPTGKIEHMVGPDFDTRKDHYLALADKIIKQLNQQLAAEEKVAEKDKEPPREEDSGKEEPVARSHWSGALPGHVDLLDVEKYAGKSEGSGVEIFSIPRADLPKGTSPKTMKLHFWPQSPPGIELRRKDNTSPPRWELFEGDDGFAEFTAKEANGNLVLRFRFIGANQDPELLESYVEKFPNYFLKIGFPGTQDEDSAYLGLRNANPEWSTITVKGNETTKNAKDSAKQYSRENFPEGGELHVEFNLDQELSDLVKLNVVPQPLRLENDEGEFEAGQLNIDVVATWGEPQLQYQMKWQNVKGEKTYVQGPWLDFDQIDFLTKSHRPLVDQFESMLKEAAKSPLFEKKKGGNPKGIKFKNKNAGKYWAHVKELRSETKKGKVVTALQQIKSGGVSLEPGIDAQLQEKRGELEREKNPDKKKMIEKKIKKLELEQLEVQDCIKYVNETIPKLNELLDKLKDKKIKFKYRIYQQYSLPSGKKIGKVYLSAER